jgi:hypothetical protein
MKKTFTKTGKNRHKLPFMQQLLSTEHCSVVDNVLYNPLTPAGRTERKKILKHPIKTMFFLAVILLMVTKTEAQTNSLTEAQIYKHELSVSYGAFTQPVLIPIFYNLFYPIVLGGINVEYFYNFNKTHSIAIALSTSSDILNKNRFASFELFATDDYIKEHPYILKRWGLYNSLQFGYRISYPKKGRCAFYSLVFAGLCIGTIFHPSKEDVTQSSDWLLPALHLTVLGISIGTKNIANLEFGLGTQGMLKIGYSYKF